MKPAFAVSTPSFFGFASSALFSVAFSAGLALLLYWPQYRNDANFNLHLGPLLHPSITIEEPTPGFPDESGLGPSALIARWTPYIAEASHRFGVPEQWIRAVIRQESGGRLTMNGAPITSQAGAAGLMQLMRATYDEMRSRYSLGEDVYNPRDNIMAGAAYLRQLHKRYGYPNMFAAYNAGPTRLEAHLHRGRRLPAETRNYLKQVVRFVETAKPGAKGSRTRVVALYQTASN